MAVEVIKMHKYRKQYLYEIARDHDIVTKDDVDLFETVYNRYDESFIDHAENRAAWYSLIRNGGHNNDRGDRLMKKFEVSILDRIKKRVATIKYKP